MRRSDVLRDRGEGRTVAVTNVELFFDLVYVFAIIQLSEHLYEHLSVQVALETLVMFLAVWWAWNYTAWATGWIDPQRRRVVALMAVLMVLSLIMSASILDAFSTRDSRAETFALAYVALQLVRSGFMVWAFPAGDPMRRNYRHLLVWSAIAGVCWIAGGLVHGIDLRLVLWAVAAIVDLAAPMHGFWLPGAGHTPMRDWSLAGAHLAERCHLVLMIAFGESVLRLGESFADAHEGPSTVIAFLLGFVLAFALWALYFMFHAESGSEAIHNADDDAARIGRSGYAYAHALMVAGLIVVAVDIHRAIIAPAAASDAAFATACIAGPALYLAGIILFKHSIGQDAMTAPLIGIAALAALGTAASFSTQIVELIAATVVAAGVGLAAVLRQS